MGCLFLFIVCVFLSIWFVSFCSFVAKCGMLKFNPRIFNLSFFKYPKVAVCIKLHHSDVSALLLACLHISEDEMTQVSESSEDSILSLDLGVFFEEHTTAFFSGFDPGLNDPNRKRKR